MTAVFPDNSVAIDFAIVGKMDLLLEWIRDRGMVCEAVDLEMKDHVGEHQEMRDLIDALGVPIKLSRTESDAAEDIRRNRLGGTEERPRDHLGEAHTLFVLRERSALRGAVWLSDDVDSCELAEFWSIRAMTSVDVLCELMVERGHTFHQEAFQIWVDMYAHPKGGCTRPTNLADMRRRAGL
ncbi:hypothetical protein Bequi_13395 [Brachybacterium sp. JHP9]|uniref:Uncharacterized protein n=1 Tax=Brachybacterium equifaecis TaxID=2910770 RepID=A0ABT0R3N6_9MICO|nr:hypothetical protein [Brachybacterium equifaecis]MCL6424359.1 hypothetical protein [Brachybacterium equifaecis]